jgi:hypothetical protein
MARPPTAPPETVSFAFEVDEEEFAQLHGLLACTPIEVRDGFVEQLMVSLVREEERLDGLLMEKAVPVREGFVDEVMASLPDTDWAQQRSVPWAAAIAATGLLGLAAALLLGRSSGTSVATGLLAAIGDLLSVCLAAAAGFLGASWGGLHTVASEAMQGSPLSLALVAAMAAAFAGALYGLLRRRPLARVSLDSRDRQ